MRKATHFVLSQGEELVWIVEGVYPDIDKASEAAARVSVPTGRCVIARLVPASNAKVKAPSKGELKGGKL